jgi:hypothetical protein
MTKRRKKISSEQIEARRRQFAEAFKGLTDAQIADIHEVSVRTVQRWKKGEYDPGIHLKFALHDKMSQYGHFVGDHQRPETLTRHYQHVTRLLHRKTIAKIPPLDLNP